jgi:hypothetical protein
MKHGCITKQWKNRVRAHLLKQQCNPVIHEKKSIHRKTLLKERNYTCVFRRHCTHWERPTSKLPQVIFNPDSPMGNKPKPESVTGMYAN